MFWLLALGDDVRFSYYLLVLLGHSLFLGVLCICSAPVVHLVNICLSSGFMLFIV